MRRFLIPLGVLAASIAALAAPAAAMDNRNNWHIHDGAAQHGHLPIGFFPTILGQTQADYLADPAQCPNATDKALLPSGMQAGMPLRAGVCFTSTKVIHLRTLAPGEEAPGGGWTLLGPTDGGAWLTYYQVTDR